MRLRLAFLLLTYLGTRILAHSVLKHSDLVVHESVISPGGFVRVGAAAPDLRLNLRLGLVSADFATLEQRLYEVSTPSSTKYGQHLSTDEVARCSSVSSFYL
jgi:tripeptidyl-peptidase-1